MALTKCIDQTLMVKMEEFATQNEIEIKVDEAKSAE